MSPYTAFKQILLTESQRHPPAPTPEEAAAADAAAAKSKSTSDSDDDDEPIPSPTPTLLPPSQTLAMSLSRIGTPTQRIISGTLEELASLPEEEFGDPLHSVVIVGKRLHPMELEFAGRWCVGGENGGWWRVGKEVYGIERESR